MAIELTRRGAATAMLSIAGSAAAAPRRQAFEPNPTGYAQAWMIEDPSSFLFISGQVPVDGQGETPAGFAEQARLAWGNILAQLRRAGMDFSNLAKVTIYLSDRRYRSENTRVRAEMLGLATPAITVVIADIFDEAWLLEIEAIACS